MASQAQEKQTPMENDSLNKNVLMAACRCGDLNLVEKELQNNADINTRDGDGQTALMVACQKGHEDIARLLIRYGIDIEAHDKNRRTAQMIAEDSGHNNCVNLLEFHGLCRNKTLIHACQNGLLHSVTWRLDRGDDVNAHGKDGVTSLMAACQNGYVNIVEVLLQNGSDVNARDINKRTALMVACENGHADCVRTLLHDCNDIGSCEEKQRKAFKEVLSAPKNDLRATLACRKNVNINTIDSEGSTSLTIATSKGHADCVYLLVLNGAGYNARKRVYPFV